MTCTTFLHDGELNVSTTNKLINDLLKEVREKTKRDWQIIERFKDVEQPWWAFWRGHETCKSYELYVFVGGIGPWQQINFYRDNTDWSINLVNPAELVIAYLYGILAGIHDMELLNETH